MPSLFRFVVICAILAACTYGVVYALANFVEPTQREMTVSIPKNRFTN